MVAHTAGLSAAVILFALCTGSASIAVPPPAPPAPPPPPPEGAHPQPEAATIPAAATIRLMSSGEDGAIQWTPLPEFDHAPDTIVLLIHGLDEPGAIWDDLALRLSDAGIPTARFEYPNDQAIASSTDLFAAALRELLARGVQRLDIVAHSMGGLVARDALTRPSIYNGAAQGHDDLPDIRTLIMVGPPNQGSPFARLQILAEAREHLVRLFDGHARDGKPALEWQTDGDGEAAIDLLPGSAFLKDLNARPAPRGVRMTIIYGEVAGGADGAVEKAAESSWVEWLLGRKETNRLAREVQSISGQVGDGVVPSSSARLEGVEDVVRVSADHRSILHITGAERSLREAVDATPRVAPALDPIMDRLRPLHQPPAPDEPPGAPPAGGPAGSDSPL